jgi:hypothetical protein
MTTTVDLTEQEIAELKELTHQEDVTAAVRVAMTEYLRYVRRQRLKALSGRVEMEENWADMENAEMRPSHADPGAGAVCHLHLGVVF